MKPKKVPVVMQMETTECGAASLCMILAYYNKWVPLEKVREDCGVSRDGSNAKNLLLAARNYGLEANAYKYELEEIKTANLPCIIHWNLKHFVVLCGFEKHYAVINDPARGTVRVHLDDFNNSFTGIGIIMKPTESFVPEGSPKSVIKFVKSKLNGTLAPFIFVMVTGLITTLISIINPTFGRVFIDQILSKNHSEWLLPLIWLMAGIIVVQFIVSIINSLYLLKIQGKMALSANSSFFWHILRLPMSFFSQRYAGDIVSRQSSNEAVSKTLITLLAPILINLVMLVFFIVIMFRNSVFLTLIALLSAVFNVFIFKVISKKRMNITRVQMKNIGNLSSCTTSGIKMIETIKSSGSEDDFFERWAGYQAASTNAEVKFLRINQFLGAVPTLVQSLVGVIILIVGSYLIMIDQFTVGALFAFQSFMVSMLAPFLSLINVGQQLQEMRSSMERIEDVLSYKTDVDYNHEDVEEISGKLMGNVELKNVTFGYARLTAPILKNFSVSIKTGEKIAIVGASGCGKSTLAKLICGLYQPWSGEILFDGKPRENYCREVLTSSIGVVDQDIIMFEDTIANNIRMWDSSIEDFEMILAARDAQIHDDIIRRQGGFNSKILEGGKNFSGGQRQRIEIARVLAQDPTIIILDEATSALDSITEFNVVDFIHQRGITCIIVAHRLSTIRDCNKIIVLDKGEIVEQGTHDELIKINGFYTQLVTNE